MRSLLARFARLVPLLAASLSPAWAQPAPSPAGEVTREQASLEGYGLNNPTCMEWNDGCATCLRRAGAAAHCSTPGIACQPKEIVCVASPR